MKVGSIFRNAGLRNRYGDQTEVLHYLTSKIPLTLGSVKLAATSCLIRKFLQRFLRTWISSSLKKQVRVSVLFLTYPASPNDKAQSLIRKMRSQLPTLIKISLRALCCCFRQYHAPWPPIECPANTTRLMSANGSQLVTLDIYEKSVRH